jgi:hypothetical protein
MSRRRAGSGRRLPFGALVVGGILLAVLVTFIAVVVISVRQQAGSTSPEGVKTFHNLSRRHTGRPVEYPQTPPVGGPHSPVWQNCGFYSEPVRNENAVHSIEHGAVWITYRPDLPREQVDKLRELANSQSYVLVSPYPGLASPIVASAWGKQLTLSSANDPRLEEFIQVYRQGPQTPEPGAPCTGGVGSPE